MLRERDILDQQTEEKLKLQVEQRPGLHPVFLLLCVRNTTTVCFLFRQLYGSHLNKYIEEWNIPYYLGGYGQKLWMFLKISKKNLQENICAGVSSNQS